MAGNKIAKHLTRLIEHQQYDCRLIGSTSTSLQGPRLNEPAIQLGKD